MPSINEKHENISHKGKNSLGNEEVVFDSKFAKDFHSVGLNEGKFDSLLAKAELIRLFKNHISEQIHQSIHQMKDTTKHEMIKLFNCSIQGLVGQDVQHAIVHVFTSYSNKFDQIKQKMTFKVLDKIEVTRYKRNSGAQKKGDIKNYEPKMKSTSLTKVMSFLARNQDENTISYVNNQIIALQGMESLTKDESDKKAFFHEVLRCIEKFGEERLFVLAKSKRDNVYAKYNKEPICFKSLTFATVSRCSDPIVSYSKNFDGETNAYVSVGGMVCEMPTDTNELVFLDTSDVKRQSTETIAIPVVFSKKYHGNIQDFSKEKPSYLMCFDEKKKHVRVIVSVDGQRSVFVGGTEIFCADVNLKHNLFATSTKETIDFDRNLMGDFVKFLKHIDKKKERKKENSGLTKEQKSSLSNRDQQSMNSWLRKIDGELQKRSVELVKMAISEGKNHIGMEDLGVFGAMFSRSEEFDGFKYSRLASTLGLSSLSDIVRGIAYAHGVAMSLLPAQYSSQKCNCCKTIDKANRKTQEEFCCVACGYEENADFVSGANLFQILFEDVLREGLLAKNDLGELFPKKLSKWKIRDILTQSCGCNGQMTLDVKRLNEHLEEAFIG